MMCARLDTTGLLADVTYAVLRGEVEAGREQCKMYRRADGGYWMTSDLDLASPRPLAQYVEIRAGADWRVESLDVRLSGSVRRDASHCVEGDVWRATIQTDEATVERTVPFGSATYVEFDSVWLDTLLINCLKLAPGQVRKVDVIHVELPLLEPVSGHVRYECIGLERITTPAGKRSATHLASGARHMWADSRGIIVATHNAVSRALLKYHWLG